MVNMSVPYSIKATYYSCVMLAVAGDIKELERSKREGITRLVVYI